jgi:hypothetical protein
VERGEWPKLLQFGLFGFLLQMGMGVGFAAGDAAFLSNVGADKLPVIFLLTPAVMLIYTAAFSWLMVRFSIDHMVDLTLALLVAGGAILWALIGADLPPAWETAFYYGLKLYLAVWYIALYTLFWTYTDSYFDIQDAKRLFPLFAACCALGTASGALVVGLLAEAVPMHYFLLLWSGIALMTAPLARLLRRRWRQIAENDADMADETDARGQLAAVARAFATSRYSWVLTATLFITLLMTNLAEYQYSTVLQEGRSEAELAALFGKLYAASNAFNLIVCLFVFNRLVSRWGVRNVALVLPLTYFAVFGYFFLQGGAGPAIAAFFAYHGVLTSIEYNNQNLLFNAVPSAVKRPLRTVIEGMCEPIASFVAGGFLLLAATGLDMRELSGIGVITGLALIATVIALRQLYPAAMAANMRQGWLNFGDPALASPRFDAQALELLRTEADGHAPAADPARALLAAGKDDAADTTGDVDALAARIESGDATVRARAIEDLKAVATAEDVHLVPLLAGKLPQLDRSGRRAVIALFGRIADTKAIPDILAAAGELAPRDRRAIAAMLAGIGETSVPRLISALRDRGLSYRIRSIAARALAEASYAQFAAQLDPLVRRELTDTGRLLASARRFEAATDTSPTLALLARAQRERVAASVDFALELLALGGQLPDFDLLVVSLHSANAKVCGNAIETIESGVSHAIFHLLEPLLRPRDDAPASDSSIDPTALLEQALATGRDIEATTAAQALAERLPRQDFARRARSAIRPNMSSILRDHLLTLLEPGADTGSPRLDILIALAAHEGLGGASLEALLALAAAAASTAPGEPALQARAGTRPFWLRHRDLREVASRYPDLALVLFKSGDDRPYAA